MRFIRLVIFISLLSACGARAGVPVLNHPKTKPAALQIDTSSITLRHFNHYELADYARRPEFQYRETIIRNPSWRTRFWRWFWHLFDGPAGETRSRNISKFFEYLFITLGIAAIVFLITRLMGVDFMNIFSRKTVDIGNGGEHEENIYEINFEQQIEQAVAQGNYRLAVRLLYLRCLRQLDEAGLINWQIDKTNTVYVNELTDAEQRSAFKLLTRQFEFAWYGGFRVDAGTYQYVSGLFNNFKVRR